MADMAKKLRRLPTAPPPTKSLEWVALVTEDETSGAVGDKVKEQSHEELRRINDKRQDLLSLARTTSASSTLFKLWQLPRTVLPRLVCKPIIWLVLLTFAAGAFVSRYGILTDEMHAEAYELGPPGATTVTFIVVFYVGYCYTRSNQQFDDVQVCLAAAQEGRYMRAMGKGLAREGEAGRVGRGQHRALACG